MFGNIFIGSEDYSTEIFGGSLFVLPQIGIVSDHTTVSERFWLD